MAPLIFLWSVPRCLSTAFLRMMIERGDIFVVSEPFSSILVSGCAEIGGEKVYNQQELVAALVKRSTEGPVFVKETTEYRYDIVDDPAFPDLGVHAFMIRSPKRTIASHYAMNPEMTCAEVGYEHQNEILTRVAVTGCTPLVIEAEGLLVDPRATVMRFCLRVGIPFLENALSWSPGKRQEWGRTRQWHRDAERSSGFAPIERNYPVTVDNHPGLAAFYQHHLPFYEQAKRLSHYT